MEKLIIEENKDLLIDIIPLLIQEHCINNEEDFYRLYDSEMIEINGEIPYDINQVMINFDIVKIGTEIKFEIVK